VLFNENVYELDKFCSNKFKNIYLFLTPYLTHWKCVSIIKILNQLTNKNIKIILYTRNKRNFYKKLWKDKGLNEKFLLDNVQEFYIKNKDYEMLLLDVCLIYFNEVEYLKNTEFYITGIRYYHDNNCNYLYDKHFNINDIYNTDYYMFMYKYKDSRNANSPNKPATIEDFKKEHIDITEADNFTKNHNIFKSLNNLYKFKHGLIEYKYKLYYIDSILEILEKKYIKL
tara:strand:- start:14357 stop:15037 length:681 start_codon:yes stop_codon:yes gene_type:complete